MSAASSRGTLRGECQPARLHDWRFRLTEQRTIETTTTEIDPAPRDPATTVVVTDSGQHGGQQGGGAGAGGRGGARGGPRGGGRGGGRVGGPRARPGPGRPWGGGGARRSRGSSRYHCR